MVRYLSLLLVCLGHDLEEGVQSALGGLALARLEPLNSREYSGFSEALFFHQELEQSVRVSGSPFDLWHSTSTA